MSVKIAHLAQAMVTITIKVGAKVKEILAKAEMEAKGDIFVNGRRAGFGTKCKNGDILGIVGQIEGGR
jgi:hypothetical protein